MPRPRLRAEKASQSRASNRQAGVSASTLYAWAVVLATACGPSSLGSPGVDTPASADGAATPPAGAGSTRDLPTGEWFTDVAEASGLHFSHFNGMSGGYYLNEIMGSGGALLDIDNDGDLDVYLIQGQMLGPGTTIDDALFPPPTDGPLTDRLYRNDLVTQPDGAVTLRFTDITEGSGLDVRSYGMGVATGDINNDGWVDVYRTRHGPNQLFVNNGDGTFKDISAEAGVDDGSWGVSATFADIDRDGWLDLYVGNYVDYRVEADIECHTKTGQRDYCAPRTYRAAADRMYLNEKDGTFRDVTDEAGLTSAYRPALGVLAADLDTDGWVDLYVANDGEPNHLWMNDSQNRDETLPDSTIRFRNGALLAGVALNSGGDAEASMGVDAGDFDGDGDDDLFLTHIVTETNTLYVNDGTGFFEDRSAMVGLGASSLPYTGFGTSWFDFDNDGWLDVLVVNGAVSTVEALAQAGDAFPLHQRNQLFRNLGTGAFENLTDEAGAVFGLSEVSRGAAFGDVDNDGDVDVLVTNNNGPTRLLRNNVGHRQHWLGLRLVGADGRDMVGARVAVVRETGPVLWRRTRADGSYASANDPRAVFGLGAVDRVTRVRVIWPSQRSEDWTGLDVDQWTTLTEGTGEPASGNLQ